MVDSPPEALLGRSWSLVKTLALPIQMPRADVLSERF